MPDLEQPSLTASQSPRPAVTPQVGPPGQNALLQLLPVGENEALAQWHLPQESLQYLRQVTGNGEQVALTLRVQPQSGGPPRDMPILGAEGSRSVLTREPGLHQVTASVGGQDAQGRFFPVASSGAITLSGPPLPEPAPRPELPAEAVPTAEAEAEGRTEGAEAPPRAPEPTAPPPRSAARSGRPPPAPRFPLIPEPDVDQPLSALARMLVRREPSRIRPSSGRRKRAAKDVHEDMSTAAGAEGTHFPQAGGIGPSGEASLPATPAASWREKTQAHPIGMAPPASEALSETEADAAIRSELAHRGIQVTEVPLPGDDFHVALAPSPAPAADELPNDALNAGFSLSVAPLDADEASTEAGEGHTDESADGQTSPSWASGQSAPIEGVEAVVKVEGRLQPGYALWLFGEKVTVLTEGRLSVQHRFSGEAACTALLAQLPPPDADGALLTVAPDGAEPILRLEASLHLSGRASGSFAERIAAYCEVNAEGWFSLERPLPHGALLLSGCLLLPE
ncbi:MAG: hypothetical protein ACFB21_12595 [Opitutales bacterium]